MLRELLGDICMSWNLYWNLPCNPPCWENIFKNVMVSQKLRHAHLLEVGLTQIPGDPETLSIVRHVDFSSTKSSLDLQTFTFVCEVNLNSLCPYDQ